MSDPVAVRGWALGRGRNGLPAGARYVYRAAGWETRAQAILAAIAASGTAGYGQLPGTGEAPSAAPAPDGCLPVPPPVLPAETGRCGGCGYLETRCCCRGGPRA